MKLIRASENGGIRRALLVTLPLVFQIYSRESHEMSIRKSDYVAAEKVGSGAQSACSSIYVKTDAIKQELKRYCGGE